MGTHTLYSTSTSTVTLDLTNNVKIIGYHLYIKNASGSPKIINFANSVVIDGSSVYGFARAHGCIHLLCISTIGPGSWIVLSDCVT